MNDLLTPDDVKMKRFHTHRLIEGYDMDEVDDFLDHVHDTILRMTATLLQQSKEQK